MTTPIQIQIRKARGSLTQKEVAAKLQIPVATWRDWEQGRRSPPLWALRLILWRLEDEKSKEAG